MLDSLHLLVILKSMYVQQYFSCSTVHRHQGGANFKKSVTSTRLVAHLVVVVRIREKSDFAILNSTAYSLIEVYIGIATWVLWAAWAT